MTTIEIARRCLEHQAAKGHPRAARTRIARMVRDACGHHADEIILVTEVYGNRCTIERPYTPEGIAKEIARGSGLTTGNPCVGVPVGFVEFIDYELKEERTAK